MNDKPRPKFSPAVWLGLPLAAIAVVVLASGLLSNLFSSTAAPTPQPTLTSISTSPEPTTPPPPSSTPRPATPTPSKTPYPALSDAPTATPSATPTPFVRVSQRDTISPGLRSVSPLPTPTQIPHVPCTAGLRPVNLTEGPGSDYGLISTLAAETPLAALKRVSGSSWLLVETDQGQVGWVDGAFISCQGDLAVLPLAAGVVVQAPVTLGAGAPGGPATSTPSPPPAATDSPPFPLSPTSWRGEYYDNPSLLGEPVLIRQDSELDFNWILDSPAPGVPADNFSVRWTRQYDFEGGDYRFFAEVDDGIRVYLDGWPVIDAWHTALPVPYSGGIADVGPGVHTVVVEYFESGGYAHVKVWFEKTVFADNEWSGEYFANSDLQEPAFLTRQDQELDFDWGSGAPIEGFDGNHFSVRWRRTVYFDGGDYKFLARVAEKDRVKIYLDGWLIFDEDTDESKTVEGYFGSVGPGAHTVTVEYQEHGSKARIKVWWEKQS